MMKFRTVFVWAGALSLAAAFASVDCGGDDTSATGTAGSGGTSTTSGGQGGSGGTTGTGGEGGSATGGGGTGGSGGAGGVAGSGGGGTAGGNGESDGGVEAASDDAPGTDASPPDGPTANGVVPFSAVTTIFNAHCAMCHQPKGSGPQLFDLQTAAGLRDRLIAPLPANQEGRCGYPDNGGDDGGNVAALPNRQAIVPGDTSASLLYRKITNTQPMGCRLRMPPVNVAVDDGGPARSASCNQAADGGAAANCLSDTEIDTIGTWITQGADDSSSVQ
jgi:hypothetical protein